MVLLERASEIGELSLFFPKLLLASRYRSSLVRANSLFSRFVGMADTQKSVWKRGNLLSMARIQ